MAFLDHSGEIAGIEGQVDLRRGEGSMPEESLDGWERSAVFQQMGGEAVPARRNVALE